MTAIVTEFEDIFGDITATERKWLSDRIVAATDLIVRDFDNNHRNAILESAALVAEQIDGCHSSTHDNGGTEDGYRQAKSQIAAAIRALKLNEQQVLNTPLKKREDCPRYDQCETGTAECYCIEAA